MKKSIFLNIILTKVYYNMDNLKFDSVNVEYDYILSSFIVQKNYNCDNPNCPLHCAFIHLC